MSWTSVLYETQQDD